MLVLIKMKIFLLFLEKYVEYRATSKENNKRKSLTKIAGNLIFLPIIAMAIKSVNAPVAIHI